MSVAQSAEELRVQLVSEERYLEDRVAHVERHFAALATDLGGVVRKTARLRDKGDQVVKTLQDFSSAESGTMKKSLEGVTECFSALEDCQQLKIDRLETKVVKPLVEYDSVCRKAREELKSNHSVGEREVTKQRNLDRVRIRDPANRKRIFESDLQKAKIERLRATKGLEDYMEAFERKKTQDLKLSLTLQYLCANDDSCGGGLHGNEASCSASFPGSLLKNGESLRTRLLGRPHEVLGEFIHAQMAFHAKALELYTLAHQHVQAMNEDETVELFYKGLHPRRPGSRPVSPRTTPRSTPDHSSSINPHTQ